MRAAEPYSLDFPPPLVENDPNRIVLASDWAPVDHRYGLIWETVMRIPEGRVGTYGQVAAEIGFPRHARMVGRAMRSLPQDSPVPWHRVVGAGGRLAIPRADAAELQRNLLEDEGVGFQGDRVDLANYAWEP